MNVRELVDLLNSYSGNMRVVVIGYEDGYDDLSPEQISIERITLDTGHHAWEGRHGHADAALGRRGQSVAAVEALVLHRTSH